ncbi:MAG: hypothetical protein PHD42_06030, partial [Dysgonamonadaceae bacterium]|nr:hypothetical protein [Dysgonamonadaceae bacterium]
SIGEIAKKDRMGKIDKTRRLSVSRRCELMNVPRMTNHLRGLGYEVNPTRVCRLYHKMDLYAIGPRPNTSKSHKGEGHAIYPYLLRGLTIERPNQVWAMDITYIPLAG